MESVPALLSKLISCLITVVYLEKEDIREGAKKSAVCLRCLEKADDTGSKTNCADD